MYPHDSSSTLLQSSNLKIIRAVKALMLAGLGFLLAGFASISQAMYFPTAEFVSEFAQRGATQEAILELPKLAPVYSEYGYQWVGDYRQCEVEDWSQFTAFEDAKGLKFEKIQTETDGTSTYRVILTDKRRAGQRLCIGMRGSQGGVTTFTDPIRWGLRLAEAEDQSTETSTNTTEETENGTQDAQDNSETTTEGSDTSSDATTTDQPEASTGPETDETSSSDRQPSDANSTTDTEDNKDTTTTDTNAPDTLAPALSGDLTSGQGGQPAAALSGDDLIQPAPELAGLSVRSAGDNLSGAMELKIFMVTGANQEVWEPGTSLITETINSYLRIAPSGNEFVMYNPTVKITFPKKYVGYYPSEGTPPANGVKHKPTFAITELAQGTQVIETEDADHWYFEYKISEFRGGRDTTIPFQFRMQKYVTPKDRQTTVKVEIIDSDKVTKYDTSYTYTNKVSPHSFSFFLNTDHESAFYLDPLNSGHASSWYWSQIINFYRTYTDARILSGVLVGKQKFDLPVNYYGPAPVPTMTTDAYVVDYHMRLWKDGAYNHYSPAGTVISIKLPEGAVFKSGFNSSRWSYDAGQHIITLTTTEDAPITSSVDFVLHYPNQPIDKRQEPVASVIFAKGTPYEEDLGTQIVSTRWTITAHTLDHSNSGITKYPYFNDQGQSYYHLKREYNNKNKLLRFDKNKSSQDYGDSSSFYLLAYHLSDNPKANVTVNQGMTLTELMDYDLDPKLYYAKITFLGFASIRGSTSPYVDFSSFYGNNNTNFGMSIYGIKTDGTKDLLGSNLKAADSINIMDKDDQYDKLQVLFDTPLMIRDQSVVFRVNTYVKDAVREDWKTTLTGESERLYNHLSGYYTLPNDTTSYISTSSGSLQYIQPLLDVGYGHAYDSHYSLIYGNDNNQITVRIAPVEDWGVFRYTRPSPISGALIKMIGLLPEGMIPTGTCSIDNNNRVGGDTIIDASTVIRNYKNTNQTAHIVTYRKGSNNDSSPPIHCLYTLTNEMKIGTTKVNYYHYWDSLPYPNKNSYLNIVDTYDFDNDGNIAEKFIRTDINVTFNAAREIILKNTLSDTTNASGAFLSISPVEKASDFYYKMNIFNNSLVPASNLTIYNVLPAIGDHTIVADKDGSYPARGSAFPVNLVRSLESVSENALLLTQWDIYYSTDDQTQTTAQMANVSWKRAGDITDFSAVKMIKIVQKPGSRLDTNAQANFYLHSRIPDGLNQPDMSTAVGSSAFSTNGAQFYEGNRVTLQLVNNYRLDGKVFDDVSGTGSLVGAIPLQGYTVTLYSGDTVVSHNGQPIATQTDQHGNYNLTIPRKGTYTVRVEDIGRHTTGTVLFTNQYGAYVAGSGNDATRIGATMMYVSTPFTVDGYNVSNPARPFDKPSSMIATRNIGFRHSSTPFAIFKHEANHLTRGLSGAVFQVIDQDGVIVDTMTTSETGYAISKPILHGNYTLKELTAPIGYAVSRDNPTITIPYQGMYYIANTKLVTNVTICAIDTETNQPILTPVAFDFAHHQGLTTVDGCVTAPDVPYGNPTLTGTTPPYGYTGSVITGVTVDGNTPTVNVPFTPIRVPFGFMKLDATNADKTLEGAVFHVTDANGQLVDTITTSHTGYGVSIPLRYGRYKLKEITPPHNYALVDTEFDIEIPTSTLNLATIVNHPLTGSLIFTKVDHRDQTKKLSGAIFAIQTMTGHELIRVMTDDQGSASVSGLIYGNYRVVEVEAPHHYIPASGFDITINRNTQPYTFLVPNEKKQGKVKVTKVDQRSDKWFLPGAVFELRDKETNTLVDTVTTNASGFVFSKPLPYGHYEIVETKAPKDYDLTFTGATIVIEHPDQEITISNRVTWKDGVPFTPPSPKPSVPSTGTVTTPVITGSIVPPSTGTVRPPLTGLILPPYTGTVLPPLDIPTKPDKTHDSAPDQPTPPKKPTPIKTYVPKLPKTGALENDEIALIRVVRVPHRKLVLRDSLFMVGS